MATLLQLMVDPCTNQLTLDVKKRGISSQSARGGRMATLLLLMVDPCTNGQTLHIKKEAFLPRAPWEGGWLHCFY